MPYLLDTDILSNLLKPTPSVLLIRRLSGVPVPEQSTSSITIGELLFGAHRHRTRERELVARIELDLVKHLQVVPFDLSAARRYSLLRAELERAGTPIGDADTRIAAIALARDMTVVTGNTRHFSRVPGLTVENWLIE